MKRTLLFLASALVLMSDGLHAAMYIPTFQDERGMALYTAVDQWTDLSRVNHPTYPASPGGLQVWPSAIGPDAASSRGTGFQKADLNSSEVTDFLGDGTGSGASQTFGGGIYVFTSTTVFQINSTSPLTHLSSLDLQISMALGSPALDVIGGPTLTLHTTAQDYSLSATASSVLSSGTVNTSFGPATVNLLDYGWDLSGISGDVTGFSIDWAVETHSITYGAQLTQGAADAVPEPSTWALMSLAGAGLVLLIKRRRSVGN